MFTLTGIVFDYGSLSASRNLQFELSIDFLDTGLYYCVIHFIRPIHESL